MTEEQAKDLAKRISGEAWHSGGGIWLVIRDGADGTVAVSDGSYVSHYTSREAFHAGAKPTLSYPDPGI